MELLQKVDFTCVLLASCILQWRGNGAAGAGLHLPQTQARLRLPSGFPTTL